MDIWMEAFTGRSGGALILVLAAMAAYVENFMRKAQEAQVDVNDWIEVRDD